jgi:hypothetical protein
MDQPGLDHRHRDKGGEISRKHGDTLVLTLRRIYGRSFAASEPATATLTEVLHKLDEPSLTKLVHDHQHDQLNEKIVGNTLSSGGA